jgi:uncharacterized heparinase superfamily protein
VSDERSTIERVARAAQFARHVPLRNLVRRIDLTLRRAARDRWPQRPQLQRPAPARHTKQPSALFEARTGTLRVVDLDKIELRFIGRSHIFDAAAMDWQAPGRGARDQLWCMNLHYMEFLEAADDALFERLVDSWMIGNPGMRRGAWRDSWNSYALSLRVVVWMQQLAARNGRLPATLIRRMETSLAEQLRFLMVNLETDLGGNHLIKNIKALIWGSAFFEGAEAREWRTTGLKLLNQEYRVQVLDDGMHFERSPSYHCQILADFLEIRHALGEDPFAGDFDSMLKRMAQAAADMTHPDGAVALFNDAGQSMAYRARACLDVLTRVTGGRVEAQTRFALRQAGYYGHRDSGSLVVVDCGRIAPDALPAHGHGDVLSFEWSVQGQHVIVDQGVFEYVDGKKRRLCRSAAQHNTLCLEGADQADFFGAFRCGRRPNVQVREYRETNDGFVLVGSHDGFAHLPGRPVHERRFEVGYDVIDIRDEIEGATDHDAVVSLLLHPACAVRKEDETTWLTVGDVRIAVTASLPIQIEPAAWWPDMGYEVATMRLRVRLGGGARTLSMRLQVQ